jgi:hypothetical protein
MRLNLDRVQRAAENQPQEALNDSSENACLASFKRSNSGHRGYLTFLRWREAPAIERDFYRRAVRPSDRQARDRLPIDPP